MNASVARAKPMISSFRRALTLWQVYLLILPAFIYTVIFSYGPMYGVFIAFKDYSLAKGIWASPWVGMKHFTRFFNLPRSGSILFNTFYLSFYGLIAGFPISILLALSMNSVHNRLFKKSVQTITYAPHFISTVVIVGLLKILLSPTYGAVNALISSLGGESVFFFGSAKYLPHLYVWSGVWQGMGWNSIIYLAALSGVDPSLHEAAVVDGATKLQRMCLIDLPCILPTVVTMLILNSGRLLNVGFEKIFLMQTDLNLETSEVISTYVYKRGLQGGEFSFSSAVGLFNSAVNLVMMVTVNYVANKVSQISLW